MIKAGADLVFASGPHVLRGIEWYKGRLIAYSLGNLAATHTLSTQGSLALSALLRVTFDRQGRFAAGSIVPLRLVGAGTPVFDSGRTAIGRIRELSREDFGPRATRISKDGRLSPP
jgi:poly-gamma-glutamate capsule biosynthesis protein CapA/YwtB (metallophosphatase superfamily)